MFWGEVVRAGVSGVIGYIYGVYTISCVLLQRFRKWGPGGQY